MIKICGCVGITAKGTPIEPLTDEEWVAWEAKVYIPGIYDPPQQYIKTLGGIPLPACVSRCWTCTVYTGFCCPLRVPCPCIVPCLRTACFGGLGIQRGTIQNPDEWFKDFLDWSHPACPDEFKGIWWMKDNIAPTGVFTMQDGDWEDSRTFLKSTKYNWTVDACNLWGMAMTGKFWTAGGEMLFKLSPSRKWMHITMHDNDTHFAYVIQPGDVLRGPDGCIMDLTPGEDLLRISYTSRDDVDAKSVGAGSITYLYLARRIAYLDESGRLVKTKRYEEMLESSRTDFCYDKGQLQSSQAFTLAPRLEERCGYFEPPEQHAMR